MSGELRRRAEAFLHTGEDYHRARPGYPDRAVDWMLRAGVRRALDLGAGTGRLTDSLVARGLDVVAVDPSASMLEVLRRRHPHVSAVVATAERTGLAGASFDAIIMAQAWHWVDPTAASAEAARLLRPRGTLAMVWNQRVPEGPWQRAFDAVQQGLRGVDLASGAAAGARAPFREREELRYRWEREVSPEDFLLAYTTHSPFLVATPHEQERRIARWRELLRERPAGPLVERYETIAWRFTLPGA